MTWQESPEPDHMDWTLHSGNHAALVCERPDRPFRTIVIDGVERVPAGARNDTASAKQWVERWLERESKVEAFRESLE